MRIINFLKKSAAVLAIAAVTFTECDKDPEKKRRTPLRSTPQGGSAVAEQTVEAGGTVAHHEDPAQAGYSFLDWHLNGTAYSFNTPVTADLTLITQWQEGTAEY